MVKRVSCIGGTFQILFETRIAGGPFAFQKSQLAQNERGGTDGAHLLACLGLFYQCCLHAFVRVEVGSTGHTAGQHQQVGIAQVGILEEHVGLDGYSVGRLHLEPSHDTHGLDVNTASS